MATIIRAPKPSGRRRMLVQPAAVQAPEPADLNEQPVPEPDGGAENKTPEPATEQVTVDPALLLDENKKLNEELESVYLEKKALEEALSEFRGHIDTRREEAEEKGYAEGYQKGQEKAKREADAEISRINALIAGLDRERGKLVLESEDNIVEVIFAAVIKIVGESLLNREGVIKMIRNNISQISKYDRLVLRLSQRDYDVLTSADKETIYPGVDLMIDPDIECGGCILETKTGRLDARLEKQFVRFKTTLLEAHSRAKGLEK